METNNKVSPSPQVWASLVAHMVKNPPAMQETQVLSLGLEDPLEKGMYSVFLPGEFHWQSLARVTVYGVAKSWTWLSI